MSIHGGIPPSVIKRMTKYLAYVQRLRQDKTRWVSSSELAAKLGLTSSTVRQDLSHIDFSGTSKRGYDVHGLERVLTHVLGADIRWSMVVVGAGNLGRALVLHEDFGRRGFNIVGIFDADRRKAGSTVGALSVQPMKELPAVVKARDARIGIIAVPEEGAQSVADQLVACGVKGLLNLALTHVSVPRNTAVVEARIAASLLELSYLVKSTTAT